MRRIFLALALGFVCLLAFSASMSAQTGPEVLDVRPYAPVDGTSLETVSLMNGTLSVHIPIWSFAQRGRVKLEFSLAYKNISYTETQICLTVPMDTPQPGFPIPSQPNANPDASPTPGSCSGSQTGANCTDTGTGTYCQLSWTPTIGDNGNYAPDTKDGIRVAVSTDVGVIAEVGSERGVDGTYSYTGNWWKVRTPDGGSHKLAQTSTGDWRAADGTGWEYQPLTCVLRDSEGTEFVFGCTPATGPTAFIVALPGQLLYEEDTNGNRITLDYNAHGLFTGWTDTMGRQIPSPSLVTQAAATGCPAGSTGSNIWQIPGVISPAIICLTSVPVQTHLFLAIDYSNPDPNVKYFDWNTPLSTVSGFILPSGDAWTFSYVPLQGSQTYGTGYNYGDLTQIGLPTGGVVDYNWHRQRGFCGVGSATLDNSALTTRTIYTSAQASAATWQYSVDNFPDKESVSTYQSTVTDPLGNVALHTLTEINSGTFNCSYYETSVSSYDNTNHLLRTDATDFVALPAVPYVVNSSVSGYAALPTATHAIWPDGTSKTSSWSYDSGYQTKDMNGNTVSVPYGKKVFQTDFDFGSGTTSGAPLRTETTNYLGLVNVAALAWNILDPVASTSVSDVATGTLQKSAYGYDEVASLGSGNASMNLGGGDTLWEPAPPNGLVRGNRTSSVRYLNTSNNSLVTSVRYNNTGTIASIQLPLNTPYPDTTTTYGYSADYQGALLTSETNSLGQSRSYTYDPQTTLLVNEQDENQQTTTYNYYPDTRLQSIVYPATASGSPETDYAYPSTTEVDKTQLQTTGSSLAQTTLYDGLGRIWETQLLNGCAGGYVATDTQYDLDGRKASVSNPYCSASTSATDGVTSYAYDGLSRPSIVTDSDGSMQQWSYSDDATTFIDEAGSQWTRTQDALGRLQSVTEPTGLLTSYTYDAFGNLGTVNQIGNTGSPLLRSFTYDSLSRLLTSSNPETGEICYGTGSACTGGYDAHGNLLAKTDANGTVLRYTYDALNRLTSKSASDGSVSDTYTYDQSSSTNFGVGRMTMATAGPTSSPTAGTTFQYDQMGRVTGTTRLDPYTKGVWKPGMGVQYDLAGEITQLTYPDARVVSQVWDAAGRLQCVQDGPASSPNSPYFACANSGGALYTPAGAEQNYGLGNGVRQINQYNNRLQLTQATTYSPTLLFSAFPRPVMNRSYTYQEQQDEIGLGRNCPDTPTGNNGNIWEIYDAASTQLQDFCYDPLNRLTESWSAPTGGSNTYDLSYQLDGVGNNIPVDHVNTALNGAFTIDPARNQLLLNATGGVDGSGHPISDYTYDNAGNLVNSGSAGHVFGYDALSQVVNVDQGNTASYTYNGMDERVVKTTPTGWTDYTYLNGQPMAEESNRGVWTDYIYANGKKIARVSTMASLLHLHGYRDQTNAACGVEGAISGANLAGLTIADGDALVYDSQQTLATYGGVALIFTDGTGTGIITDVTTQQPLFFNGQNDGQWHHMAADLSQFAGETVDYVEAGIHNTADMGTFDLALANVAVVHANATVTNVATSTSTVQNFNGTQCGGQQLSADAGLSPVASLVGTYYYVDDHLGTAQMEFNSSGFTSWQGQFTPYGQEVINGTAYPFAGYVPADGTTMPFKFTGKERDTESGLDYFGARYYASSMGRWISPDWAQKPEAVPYSKLDDPQSLNLYGYVLNNPLSKADPDGHEGCCDVLPSMAEVDAVAGPLVASAAGSLATAAEFTVSSALAPLVAVGGMLSSTLSAGSAQEDRTLHSEAVARQEEKQEASPEPQTSTSGAGARSGGGRNGQKVNPDRAQSAKDKISDLKGQRDKLASQANKTPQDKADLKKLNNQIKHQQDRMKPSENHSQQGKGQGQL